MFVCLVYVFICSEFANLWLHTHHSEVRTYVANLLNQRPELLRAHTHNTTTPPKTPSSSTAAGTPTNTAMPPTISPRRKSLFETMFGKSQPQTPHQPQPSPSSSFSFTFAASSSSSTASDAHAQSTPLTQQQQHAHAVDVCMRSAHVHLINAQKWKDFIVNIPFTFVESSQSTASQSESSTGSTGASDSKTASMLRDVHAQADPLMAEYLRKHSQPGHPSHHHAPSGGAHLQAPMASPALTTASTTVLWKRDTNIIKAQPSHASQGDDNSTSVFNMLDTAISKQSEARVPAGAVETATVGTTAESEQVAGVNLFELLNESIGTSTTTQPQTLNEEEMEAQTKEATGQLKELGTPISAALNVPHVIAEPLVEPPPEEPVEAPIEQAQEQPAEQPAEELAAIELAGILQHHSDDANSGRIPMDTASLISEIVPDIVLGGEMVAVDDSSHAVADAMEGTANEVETQLDEMEPQIDVQDQLMLPEAEEQEEFREKIPIEADYYDDTRSDGAPIDTMQIDLHSNGEINDC